MDGEELTETDLHDTVEHAADAIEFVNQVEANAQLQAVHDEYSVVARIGELRIVSDIDRLLVTPDTYHIIDYKTNNLSLTMSNGISHNRPQMPAHALALRQHDQSQDVRASLRFPDAGIEERFDWSLDQMADVQSEFRPITNLVHNRTVRRQVLWQTDAFPSSPAHRCEMRLITMGRLRSVRRVRIPGADRSRGQPARATACRPGRVPEPDHRGEND